MITSKIQIHLNNTSNLREIISSDYQELVDDGNEIEIGGIREKLADRRPVKESGFIYPSVLPKTNGIHKIGRYVNHIM